MRREDQRQRELRRCVRRPGPGADDDSAPRAGLDVDVRRPAAGLADQPQVGEEVEQRLVDRRPLADEDERLGVADLRRPLREARRPLGLHDDVVLRDDAAKHVEPLDRPLVVLHHDDAHAVTLSTAAATASQSPGIPHGCYDSA